MKSKYVVIIVVLFFLTGCLSPQAKKEESSELKMVGTKLRVSHGSALSSYQFTHVLDYNETYTPTIEIMNHFPKQNTYRFYFFLDYEQIAVQYNYKKRNYIDIPLNANSKRKFMINIDNIPNGSHDFLVLAVRNINSPLKENREVPSSMNYISTRHSLIIGKDHFNKFKYEAVKVSNKKWTAVEPILTEGRVDQRNDALTTATTEALENLWLSSPSYGGENTFAIIAILGEQQLNLESSFIKTDRNGIIEFPINIKETFSKIDVDSPLIVGIIPDPFQKRENLKGELMTDIEWIPHFSNKILIDGISKKY